MSKKNEEIAMYLAQCRQQKDLDYKTMENNGGTL